MDNPNIQEFLGVDIGQARVGVARGNSAARLAQPLRTLPAGQAADELLKLAAESRASGIVVGLPRGLDGQDTGQTATVRAWARGLKARTEIPLYWQDEALTSRAAEGRRIDPAIGSDAYAAGIILQDFLDSAESDRVAV